MLQSSAARTIEQLSAKLRAVSEAELSRSIETGEILNDPEFMIEKEKTLAAFYAPFDWVNEDADIVLIGITPGKQQAKAALLSLRRALIGRASVEAAAFEAKAEASFKGEMRQIAARLMDHFGFQRLFGIPKAIDLFGAAASRVHYTSVFRYPVLENKGGNWSNFSGNRWSRSSMLLRLVDDVLWPELQSLKNAWLVPFGPTPSAVLRSLVTEGKISDERVLTGLNHPSGTQWNRHNCQLELVSHDQCGKNVGCASIRARSSELRQKVERLSPTAA